MDDTRHKNINWTIQGCTYPGATLAVLMDIRDELKEMNLHLLDIKSPLQCVNFLRIPQTLRTISRNTHKPKRRRKSGGAK